MRERDAAIRKSPMAPVAQAGARAGVDSDRSTKAVRQAIEFRAAEAGLRSEVEDAIRFGIGHRRARVRLRRADSRCSQGVLGYQRVGRREGSRLHAEGRRGPCGLERCRLRCRARDRCGRARSSFRLGPLGRKEPGSVRSWPRPPRPGTRARVGRRRTGRRVREGVRDVVAAAGDGCKRGASRLHPLGPRKTPSRRSASSTKPRPSFRPSRSCGALPTACRRAMEYPGNPNSGPFVTNSASSAPPCRFAGFSRVSRRLSGGWRRAC